MSSLSIRISLSSLSSPHVYEMASNGGALASSKIFMVHEILSSDAPGSMRSSLICLVASRNGVCMYVVLDTLRGGGFFFRAVGAAGIPLAAAAGAGVRLTTVFRGLVVGCAPITGACGTRRGPGFACGIGRCRFWAKVMYRSGCWLPGAALDNLAWPCGVAKAGDPADRPALSGPYRCHQNADLSFCSSTSLASWPLIRAQHAKNPSRSISASHEDVGPDGADRGSKLRPSFRQGARTVTCTGIGVRGRASLPLKSSVTCLDFVVVILPLK